MVSSLFNLQIHPIFDSLLIIHESSSDQTFFVHARLAHGRLKRIVGTVAGPSTPYPSHSVVEESSFVEVTFVSPGPEPPAKVFASIIVSNNTQIIDKFFFSVPCPAIFAKYWNISPQNLTRASRATCTTASLSYSYLYRIQVR